MQFKTYFTTIPDLIYSHTNIKIINKLLLLLFIMTFIIHIILKLKYQLICNLS